MTSPSKILLAIGAAALATACASPNFEGAGGDRRFYEARCGVCHVPWPREAHTAAEWQEILDDMAPRAGLTRSQRERVFAYLTQRGGSEADAPGAIGPPGR